MLRSWSWFLKTLLLVVLASIPLCPIEAAAQPSIRYEIQVTLDVRNRTLTGREIVRYVSGADSTLTALYLQVYPNAFSGSGSTLAQEAERIDGDFTIAQARREELGRLDITSLTVDGTASTYDVDDTSLRIKLARPCAPHDSVQLAIDFVTAIPSLPGRFRTQDGDFSIAQWYPKMAVYDRTGWHHDPYHLIGEFYGDFATYDVSITLPTQYYVGATGAYVGGDHGDNEMPRLSEGRGTAEAHKRELLGQIESKRASSMKTLYFHAARVHDFAWVASPNYLIDETTWHGIQVKALVLAHHAHSAWSRLLSYEIDALKFFTERVGDYPYPTLTVAEAYNFPGGGMEYPALAMLDPALSIPFTHALEYVTVHEVGHNWFYGALANNELDDPWLDEGFEEYFTIRYAEQTHRDGSILDLPQWASWFLDLPYRWTHEIDYRLLPPAGQDLPVAQSSLRFSDEQEYHAIVYSKGALVLEKLHALVGDSVFNRIVRTYYEEYKFRHVTIPDFIGVASRVSGKDLDLFFRQSLYGPNPAVGTGQRQAFQDETYVPIRIARPLSPFAFADPDHYVIGFNPSLWYNKVDKVQIGACLRSSYLMTYHVFSGGVSYGTGSGKTSYHAGYSTLLARAPSLWLALNAGKNEGMRGYRGTIASAHPENILLSLHQPGGRKSSAMRAALSFSYSDRYDSAYFDPKFYSLGKTAVVSLNGDYERLGFEGTTRVTSSLAQGLEAMGAQSDFTRAYVSISQDLRLVRTGELITSLRASTGVMSARAPKQEQFAIGYGVPISTVDPVGQFIASGGGGVRGYQNDAALGHQLLAFNLEFGSERFHPSLPHIDPLLFFDIGRVNSSEASSLANKTLCDAGIELRAFGAVAVSFPLWLSRPTDDHNHFAFRVVARLTLPGN